MLKKTENFLTIAAVLGPALLLFGDYAAAQDIPTLSIDLGQSDDPADLVPAMKIVGLMTVMSIAPAILLMMTSFTRILVVLGFIRQALGTPTMPPNQVVIGLSLFLTLFVMSPVIERIKTEAFDPYLEKKITQEQAFESAKEPIRRFMMKQTREQDLALFFNIADLPKPQSEAEVPMTVLIPAFMISELKTAFQIGFLVYVPFLIIDMVIASGLMAMGMLMLPPTIVSLPFKLVLFVLVDGWALIVGNIVKSFAA